MDFKVDVWPYMEKYLLPLVLAFVTLIVGLYVIKVLVKFMRKRMEKADVDPSLRPFLLSLTSAILRLCLVFSVIGMVGVETTSFIAVFAAAGLAIGMALQGTLGNFAGGVMILLFKPFKVGDFIEAQGEKGSVKEIQIFNTILTALDNRVIVIPNGPLSTGVMVNYTANDTRLVDMTFGIGYGESSDLGRKTILDILNNHPKVLKTPAEPMVAVKELGDSSVNFAARVWVNTPDYWAVYFDIQKSVYDTFEATEGLSIPYPQTDVHVHQA
jgi:small conductance mechanosensitive channel